MAGEGVGIDTRVSAVTIAKWSKKYNAYTTRHQPILRMLDRKGRISYNEGGGQLRWPFQFRDHELRPYQDGLRRDFNKFDPSKNSAIPFDRGFEVLDFVSELDKEQNKGKAAIVKYFKKLTRIMQQGASRRLPAQFWADGDVNMTGFSRPGWSGTETFMSGIGAQTPTDEFATSVTDTYGGISCSYTGLSGGSTDESEGHKAFSPVLLSTNRTVSGSTQTWADFAEEYMGRIAKYLTYGMDDMDSPDCGFLTRASYLEALDVLRRKERLNFSRGKGLDDTKFGFKHTFELDGVLWTWDVSVPETDTNSDTVRGYVLNFDRLELCCMTSKLWRDRVVYDHEYGGDAIALKHFGQLAFESPKYHGKLVDLA